MNSTFRPGSLRDAKSCSDSAMGTSISTSPWRRRIGGGILSAWKMEDGTTWISVLFQGKLSAATVPLFIAPRHSAPRLGVRERRKSLRLSLTELIESLRWYLRISSGLRVGPFEEALCLQKPQFVACQKMRFQQSHRHRSGGNSSLRPLDR